MTTREIRQLYIAIPDRTRSANATEVRRVTIDVVFSDSTRNQVITHTAMEVWPSGDLLESVKKFITELESA